MQPLGVEKKDVQDRFGLGPLAEVSNVEKRRRYEGRNLQIVRNDVNDREVFGKYKIAFPGEFQEDYRGE